MSSIKKLLFLIPKNYHLKTFFIFIFFLFNAFLELLGIGLILPVIALLADTQNEFFQYNFRKVYEQSELFKNYNFKYFILILLFFVFFVKFFFSIFLNWYQATFLAQINIKISSNLFTKYVNHEYKLFIKKNTSEIIRNVINETNIYTKKILVPFLQNIMDFLILFGIFILVYSVDLYSSLIITVAYFFLGFFYLTILKKKLYNIGLQQLVHEKYKLNSAYEPLIGIKTIKIFSREIQFIQRYIFHLKKVAYLGRVQSFLQNFPKQIIELVTIILFILLIIVLLKNNQSFNEIIPKLALFTTAAFRVIPSTNRVILNNQIFKSGIASLENLYNEVKRLNNVSQNTKVSKKIILRKKIIIKNLSFSYENTKNKKINKILDKVNLDINKGDAVAIIGKTGQGKTTLVDLILGFIKAKSGKILIDGKNINSIKKYWLHSVGYVSQDTFLLNGSLKKNITFEDNYENIDEKLLKQVVEIAKIDEFLSKKNNFKKNMEMLINQSGSNLSGGQKQRIGIARALYKNPEVIIMDEPTSSLDKDTEKKVIQNIFKYKDKKSKTLIIISHRNTAISLCNKFYKVDKKKIVKLN